MPAFNLNPIRTRLVVVWIQLQHYRALYPNQPLTFVLLDIFIYPHLQNGSSARPTLFLYSFSLLCYIHSAASVWFFCALRLVFFGLTCCFIWKRALPLSENCHLHCHFVGSPWLHVLFLPGLSLPCLQAYLLPLWLPPWQVCQLSHYWLYLSMTWCHWISTSVLQALPSQHST